MTIPVAAGAELERVNVQRQKLLDINAQLKALAHTPLDRASLAERIKSEIDTVLSYESHVDWTYLATPGAMANFRWRDPVLFGDLIELIGRAQFEKMLMAKNAERIKDGLPVSEIASRRTALVDELRATQIAEEKACLAVEKAAQVIVIRRADADAALILKLWNEEKST